jgi:AcrR family transcriptional regulator
MNDRSFVSEVASTEELILASALAAFSERGYHGSSIRQIAKGAGVSTANVYNYVQSKPELLVRVLKRASDDQLKATEGAVADAEPDVRARLAAAVGAYVKFDVERRVECAVANSELRYLPKGDRKRIVRSRDQHDELFRKLVHEGVASGVFGTPYPDLAVLAILTMCAGVTIWYSSDGPLNADDIAERYARFALALVEALP